RHGHQVVGAVCVPGRATGQLDLPEQLCGALAHTQTGDRTEVLVPVGGQLPTTQGGDDVVRQDRCHTHRVLGVGRVEALPAVGHLGVVTTGEGVLHAVDGQVLAGVDVALGPQGQVTGGHDRAGFDARGPHQGARVELGAVAEHDVFVDRRLQEGLQSDVDATATQLVEGLFPHLRADLGQDLVGRLDQVEVHFLLLDGGVDPDRVADHVLQFGHGLGAGEAAPDEHEVQGLAAGGLVVGGVGDGQPAEHVVAQV